MCDVFSLKALKLWVMWLAAGIGLKLIGAIMGRFKKELHMLEGNEIEGKVGEYGSYKVDVNEELVLEVAIGVKVNLLGEIKKLAAQTETKLDDQFIGVLEGLIMKKKALIAEKA